MKIDFSESHQTTAIRDTFFDALKSCQKTVETGILRQAENRNPLTGALIGAIC